jgi:monofunctional biosynthetic peptidoglycan transglycosylase
MVLRPALKIFHFIPKALRIFTFPLAFIIPVMFLVFLLLPVIYFIWLINTTSINSRINQYFVIKNERPIFSSKVPKEWVRLKDASSEVIWAILISEDWAFYQHEGVDWNQLSIVLKEGMKDLKFKRGASTITQQVVKNLYLTSEKTFFRKFNEIILAYYLESKKNKKEILEYYLNLAEWGPNLWGLRAAANYYFQKSPKNLNYREGAFLAMLLPNPKKYSVSFRKQELTPYASSTMGAILNKLVLAKIITEEEKEFHINTPFSWEKSLTVLEESEEEIQDETELENTN